MDTEIRVLVLAAQRWDFKGEDGQQHTGVSVYICHFGGNHSYAGSKPVKYTMDLGAYAQFASENLPALATMHAGYDFDRQKMVPASFSDFEPLVA